MKTRKFLSSYLIPILAVTLIITPMVMAGLEDRFSDIELKDSNYVYFPQITAPSGDPTSDTGWLYVKDSGGTTKIYFEDDGGTVTDLGASSSGVANLDEAYDGGGAGAGHEVAVDQDAVLLTGTNAGNNVLELTNTGTGNLIDITNTGTGKDIDGTSSTWSFTKAGVLTLANGLTVDNGTNNILEWNENSEEIKWTFGTNELDLSSSTGVITFSLLDNAAATLTHAADGAAEDFTISQTGAQNSSLHLTSAGTAADALTLTTSAGGIDITVSGGAAGEDIDITTDTSINLSATEDAASAIYLLTNGGTSETIVVTNTQGTSDAAIDINATAGGIDIDSGKSLTLTSAENTADSVVISSTVGGIDITAAGAAAGEDIDITATGSSVNITATEAAADQFKVDAQGAVAGNAINFETTNGGILLNADGAANGDIEVNAADDLALTAAGTVAIDSADWDVSATGAATGMASVGFDSATVIYHDIVQLSNADIKALRATPKELVAAPGADKFVELVSATLVLDYGSEVLTESADNLVIEYGTSNDDITAAIEMTGFIDQAADTIMIVAPSNPLAANAATDMVNNTVELFNTGDGEFGGNASADTTMTVHVAYRVHTAGL